MCVLCTEQNVACNLLRLILQKSKLCTRKIETLYHKNQFLVRDEEARADNEPEKTEKKGRKKMSDLESHERRTIREHAITHLQS